MILWLIVACLLAGALIGGCPGWTVGYHYGIGVGRYREARDHELADARAERNCATQPVPQVLMVPVQALPGGWVPQPAPQVIQALPGTEETWLTDT